MYRWDELNRLAEARRYDQSDQSGWWLKARQRYRYDGANQRTLKQNIALGDNFASGNRAALYVYPGDFERRGLVAGSGTWDVSPDGLSESQYMVAGARVVWKNRTGPTSGLDADHRITVNLSNLIGSTSAVLDLVSGELVEAGGFYPNGAREELLGAEDALNGAEIPIEPAGFTGKEAEEEVGLTYFGERYLVPRLGRWATPDPLSIHAVGGGEALNAFHYVSGNLLQARDPLGLDVFFVIYYSRPGTKFADAAATRAREIEDSSGFDSTRDVIVYQGVKTEGEFRAAWQKVQDVATERGDGVRYGAVYSHAATDLGNNLGRGAPTSGAGSLEFAPDTSKENQTYADPASTRRGRDGSLEPDEIARLPQLPWTPDGSLDLRGCRTGITNPPVAQSFRDAQQTTVRGETGYSSFSSDPDHAAPLRKGDEGGDVYLKAYYQGLFANDFGENFIFKPLGLDTKFEQAEFTPNASNASSTGDPVEAAPAPAENRTK